MLGLKEKKAPFGQRKSKGSFRKPKVTAFNSPKKKVLKVSLFDRKIVDGRVKGEKARPTKKKTTLLKKKSAKNIITAQEQEFMTWIHDDAQYLDYPCFVCGKHNPNDRIRWHHIKLVSSDKKNHKRQIPLCDNEHHRLGTEISPHGTPKKWRATYSMYKQNKFAKSVWDDFLAYKESMFS